MPSIITDPSLVSQANIVVNGSSPSSDVWSYPDTPAQSILNFQAVPTQPLPAGTDTATGLLTPDLILSGRLSNFSPEVYDLSPDSALTHFLEALLGDSGVGQLRKRQTISRLQEALTSTNFYDLDAFYGALFGAVRGPSGALPDNPATGVAVSPYTDLASPDGWDDILAIDAQFRERIIALARAITLGATVPGMRAIGEALSGYRCHVYETWRLIDTQGLQLGQVSQVTWAQVMAQYATWSSFTPGTTWNSLQGYTSSTAPSFGGLGLSARNEVIIMPRKQYGSSPAQLADEASDLYGISRVAEVLRPASALLSVTTQSQVQQVPVPIAALWADSDNWELTYTVSPPNAADPAYATALASYQRGGQPVTVPYSVPSPPFSRVHGGQVSYAAEIASSWSQGTPTGLPGTVTDSADYETEIINGQPFAYTAPLAIMDPVRAASARTAAAGGPQAAPYAGPRQPVVTPG